MERPALQHREEMTLARPAPADGASGRPQFIGSDIYRRSSYGAKHPLAIPRVSTCIDLCRALGWLPDDVYHDSPRAAPAELARFHDPAYVAALQQAEAAQSVPRQVKDRYHIGCNGNPVFREVFSRPATAAGGSMLAARLLLAARPAHGRPAVVYNPAGGTHHGRRDRASGFCYLNDPALGILTLLDGGLERVLYVDVDAHHGDGVQDAFAGDPRVLTVSVHEADRWPMGKTGGDAAPRPGSAADRGGGNARNLPVPPGFNDSELAYVLEAAILPLADAFEPQAVVLQCGSDALLEDPLSRLALSNGALWRVAAALAGLAPRVMVLGGGGYNPWSVGRCWAGVWATLNGLAVPERLPHAAKAVLRALEWRHSQGRNPPETWFTTLADPPRPGPVRAEVREAVAAALADGGAA